MKIVSLIAVLALAASAQAAETQRLANLTDMVKTGKTVALRVQAARELGELGAEAGPALRGALTDPANPVRVEAASSLERVGVSVPDEVVPAVTPALKDADRRLRARTVQILLKFGFADAVARPALLTALSAEDPEVRTATLGGLWKSRFQGSEPWAPEVLTAVLARMSDPDPRVRRIAIVGMRSFRPTPPPVAQALVKALADPEVADMAAGTIDAMPDDALAQSATTALVTAMTTAPTPAARVLAARTLSLLTGTREQFAPPLLQALQAAPDPEVRAAAAQTAGTLAADVSADALVKALADPSPKVRTAACMALAQMGSSELGERLDKVKAAIDAATKDPDEAVRNAATSAAQTLQE